ncbi:MAG: hypothetical protein ACW97Z_14480 [Candidatus Hodarchaeales archaeon]
MTLSDFRISTSGGSGGKGGAGGRGGIIRALDARTALAVRFARRSSCLARFRASFLIPRTSSSCS